MMIQLERRRNGGEYEEIGVPSRAAQQSGTGRTAEPIIGLPESAAALAV